MADPTADDKATTLLDLPLEVRHTIFEHVPTREVKPKKLLRYWFEKKEIKELIAQQVANNPAGPAPHVECSRNHDDESDQDELSAAQDEGSEDEDGEAQDDDDDDDDGEEDDNGADGNDDDDDDDANEDDENAMQEDDEDGEDGESLDQLQAPATNIAHAQTSLLATSPDQTQTANDDGEEPDSENETEMMETETTQADETESMDEDANGEHNIDGEGDADMGEDDGQDDAEGNEEEGGNAQPQPPAPVVQAAPKWRHIPKFMRISKCPPPTALFLASRQLNDEAKTWFYDVAVLHIEATGSFAHTSFFEEAFKQITDAAFSPMENIRKVEVTFVWDTTWLRADETGWVEAIFPALLRQRSEFVYQILSQAPDLREVTIHWHDSAQDDESANFMVDILAAFHSLPANVKIVEHYIATDAKPHKRSTAGKRRVEFQNIVDAGLDRLF